MSTDGQNRRAACHRHLALSRQRRALNKTVSASPIAVDLSWGGDSDRCRKCGAAIEPRYQATVKCPGATVCGCLGCIAGVVETFATGFASLETRNV